MNGGKTVNMAGHPCGVVLARCGRVEGSGRGGGPVGVTVGRRFHAWDNVSRRTALPGTLRPLPWLGPNAQRSGRSPRHLTRRYRMCVASGE